MMQIYKTIASWESIIFVYATVVFFCGSVGSWAINFYPFRVKKNSLLRVENIWNDIKKIPNTNQLSGCTAHPWGV